MVNTGLIDIHIAVNILRIRASGFIIKPIELHS